MPFNGNKYLFLQVETRNQKYEYEMSGVKVESVKCVKVLGVTIAASLRFSQHCKGAASEVNGKPRFINNFSFKNKYLILLLYSS